MSKRRSNRVTADGWTTNLRQWADNVERHSYLDADKSRHLARDLRAAANQLDAVRAELDARLDVDAMTDEDLHRITAAMHPIATRGGDLDEAIADLRAALRALVERQG